MGDEVIVVGDRSPGFGRDAIRSITAQIPDVHDLRAKARGLTLDLNTTTQALQAVQGVLLIWGRGLGSGQGASEVGPHLVQRGMVADHVDEGRGVIGVDGSDDVEEIVQQVLMVVTRADSILGGGLLGAIGPGRGSLR